MKVSGIGMAQGLDKLLNQYTVRAEEKARDESVINSSTLIEKLLPELDDLEAGTAQEQIAPDQAAVELDFSEELEKMRSDMEKFEEDLKSAKEQGEAMGESMSSMGKILAIFRRIAKGDIVPARDERKLMEHDAKMYNMAKQLGAMAKNDDPKRHKSVDSEEEQKAEMKQKIDAMMASVPEMPEVSQPAQAE